MAQHNDTTRVDPLGLRVPLNLRGLRSIPALERLADDVMDRAITVGLLPAFEEWAPVAYKAGWRLHQSFDQDE